ncbi:hypothetical protein EC988_008205, partial [Linderina pennispora]
DINAALVEENIRLGGTGDVKVPSRHPSSLDSSKQETQTAPGSPEGMSLSSAAPSPQVGPVHNGGGSQKTPSAPGSRATSSGLPSPINGSNDRPLAATLAETASRNSKSAVALPSLSAAAPAHHMSGAISPPITTAAPSAVQSTNTSPAAQATAVTGANRTIPPVTQLPPPSHNVQNSGMLPGLVPPMTPRHAAGASASMTLPTVPEMTSIAPSIAPLPRFSFPAGAGKFQGKPPAQSMPNSPSFQPHKSRMGDMHANGFTNHPFFNNMGPVGHRKDDMPSYRHHSGSTHPQPYMQQQQQQNAAGMPVRRSGLTPPQQYRQHPYSTPAHVP